MVDMRGRLVEIARKSKKKRNKEEERMKLVKEKLLKSKCLCAKLWKQNCSFSFERKLEQKIRHYFKLYTP
jgi:hypothetical protein